MGDPNVRTYKVRICDDCYELTGQMCHNWQCTFCRLTMEEVGDILNKTYIRPVVDGERLDLRPSKQAKP